MTGTITPIGVFTAAAIARPLPVSIPFFDPYADPGPANPPIMFEPPGPLTAVSTELWILGTGADPNWGGAGVYVSTDDTTYDFAGLVYRGGRQGLLAAPLASGADPDTVNTLAVDLTMSRGQLLSATQDDADNLITLCFCDGELVSYETATLTAAYQYDLTYLRRGVYGTPLIAHSAGTPFGRVGINDGSILRYRYPPSFVGQTIWAKLASFNIFGAAAQTLDEVTATRYTLQGTGLTGGTGYTPPVVIPIPPGPVRSIRTILGEQGGDSDDLRPRRL